MKTIYAILALATMLIALNTFAGTETHGGKPIGEPACRADCPTPK